MLSGWPYEADSTRLNFGRVLTKPQEKVYFEHPDPGILIWKEVRAMQEEWKEKEGKLFQSLKQALEKNKTLARNCLA